ncbi:hypothetical protein EAS54_26255 [Bradyrhizobium guangzhouense]|nr:hypothetical protein EAS54_26255 [Bradyrhizobium guangzhouense]
MFTSERAGPFHHGWFAPMMGRAGVKAGMPFRVHPHMLRHACGFAPANKGREAASLSRPQEHSTYRSRSYRPREGLLEKLNWRGATAIAKQLGNSPGAIYNAMNVGSTE